MDTLMQFIKNVGTGRLIMVGIVGAITFVFFSVVITQVNSSPMEVLFSDLDQNSANDIIAQLEGQNIEYEINGNTISVPENEVDRLRLTLAGQGLTGGVIGKEIFDQEGSFGRTSFELNVNYVRAIEGELSRTIMSLRSVSEARVLVAVAERRPFQRELSQPSASVQITARGGVLPSDQVRAIQSLVASSVPGMSADRVTVADSSGRLLADGTASGTAAAALNSLEESRRAMEDGLRQKLMSLVGGIYGYQNVRADVALELDTSRRTQNRVSFDANGQVARATDVREASETNVENSGRVTAGDNLPDADLDGAGGGGDGSERSETQEITEFDNSKVEEVVVTEPGAIRQLSVAVIINSTPPLDADGNPAYAVPADDDALADITDIIRNAVPYDEARDGADAIKVSTLQFVDPPAPAPLEEEFNLLGLDENALFELIQLTGLVVSGILFLVLVVRPLVVGIVDAIPEPAPPPDPNAELEGGPLDAPAITGPDGSVTLTPELIQRAAGGDSQAQAMVTSARTSGNLSTDNLAADSRIDVAQIEGKVQESAVQKVSSIIKDNPEESVAIVRSWLYAE